LQTQIPVYKSVAVADDAATAGTLVARDSSGDIYGAAVRGSSLRSSGNLYPGPTVAASTTAAVADSTYCELVTAGGSGVTRTLPAASSCAGREIIFVKIDAAAGALTIEGNGSETINGALNLVLSGQWDLVVLVSDGTNWVRTGGNYQGALVASSTTGDVADGTYLEKVTSGSGGVTRTLPTAVGKSGKEVCLVKVDAGAGALTIEGYASETINGSANISLGSQWDRAVLISDGANWIRKG
jgi:hypothetical protein